MAADWRALCSISTDAAMFCTPCVVARIHPLLFLMPAAAAQDEFALQTIPNENDVTGFVSANQADGSVYCDFLANGTRFSVSQTRLLQRPPW
eukprot:COSAG02_NODE_22966_length_734_cov_0.941732_1_plen_92_part_00